MPRKDDDRLPSSMTIAEIRTQFADLEPTRVQWDALKRDERAGVRTVVARIEAHRRRHAKENRRINKVLTFERDLWKAGVVHIAGCDEAGMSPLAGPVVAAAVILVQEKPIRGVDDSKVIDVKNRERLAELIKAQAISWAVGLTTPEEIDEINVYRAGLLAMKRALEGLDPQPNHVLVDARTIHEYRVPQTPLIKGDARSMSIGAASIIAKTHRDRLMIEMDSTYPGYGFAAHKGYPVAAHVEALKRLGPCPEHRRTFAPVRAVLAEDPVQAELF